MKKKEEEKLIEIVASALSDNDVRGRVDEILALIKEAGYVRLADDQSLPALTNIVSGIRTKSKDGWFLSGQCLAFDRMFRAGWRKLELEREE